MSETQNGRGIEGDRPLPSVAARKGGKAGGRSTLAMVGVGIVCSLAIGFLFLGGEEPKTAQDDPSFSTGAVRVMGDYSGPVYRPEPPEAQTIIVERETLQPVKAGDESLDRMIAREEARVALAQKEAALKSRLADEEMRRQLLLEQGRRVQAAQQAALEMEAKRRMSSVVVLDDPVEAPADAGDDADAAQRQRRTVIAGEGS